MRGIRMLATAVVGLPLLAAGCMSPYRADRGALIGGAAGAGVGAAIGEASGNPLAGALVGAGVGALSGAAIGGSLDEIEAKNRAQIEAHMARQLPAGTVTPQDVMAMSQAKVDDTLIVNHIQANGVRSRLQPADLIALQQAGVSSRVVQAYQTATVGGRPRAMAESGPPAERVIVEEHYVSPPPYWGPPPRRYWGPPPYGPGYGWGISFGGPIR